MPLLSLSFCNPFPNKPQFLRVCSTSLLKTLWEKEKLLLTSNFSFFQCFLPVRRTFCHFHQTLNCRLQTLSVWKSKKKLSFGKDLTFTTHTKTDLSILKAFADDRNNVTKN